jgi:hypothetical protein
MTKAEKRVQLAQNLLDNKFLMKKLTFGTMLNGIGVPYMKGEKLADVLPKMDIEACLVGALVLTALLNTNYKPSGDVWLNLSICEAEAIALKYFSFKQLRLIEIAFECGRGYYEAETSEELRAEKAYSKLNIQNRAKKILSNIIGNSGTFIV